MKIKRFFAKDMRTALLQVKEELGAEAVIMSNKKVAGGVEIVAAVDGETTSVAPAVTKQYGSQPRHIGTQASPKLQSTPSRRELQDDRVSLNNGSSNGASMTQRFANMLKQYSNGAHEEESQYRAENEDSLSALLKRQTDTRTTESRSSLARQLNSDSPLAKLIAEERSEARARPRFGSVALRTSARRRNANGSQRAGKHA